MASILLAPTPDTTEELAQVFVSFDITNSYDLDRAADGIPASMCALPVWATC